MMPQFLLNPHASMRPMRIRMIPLVMLFTAYSIAHAQVPEAIQFQTADSLTIYGDLYRADAPADAPMILLFHQGGGDARGEYGPLVDRLTAIGYHALAIDQRRGGTRFDNTNRTVEALPEDIEYGYCDAYPDLEAALAFARAQGFTGPKAAWGSSYSAALVFQLAAKYPEDIATVLAFSPASGDPMKGCEPGRYSGTLEVPVLVLRPAREMEIERVAAQLKTFADEGHATYVADPGVHGSSMLNPDRVQADTEATWAVVLDFLAEALDH